MSASSASQSLTLSSSWEVVRSRFDFTSDGDIITYIQSFLGIRFSVTTPSFLTSRYLESIGFLVEYMFSFRQKLTIEMPC